MQPGPQLPAQDITRQRPWWLIYGASFGVGLALIDIIHFYVLDALFGHMEFALYDFIDESLNTLFFLICFLACLVAGILVARKARRADSATLASLLVGLFFLLGGFISLSSHSRILIYVLFVNFLVVPLGIYVGFLGGLIGRTTERTRRTIGLFYAIGVVLVSIAVLLLAGGFYPYYRSLLFFNHTAIFYALSFMVLASLCAMVAWIMTLVQYAQAQSWGAFTLTFFFSGIMVLVYLIVGVQPRQPAPYVALAPGAYMPVSSAYPPPPMQPVPAQPPQPDAVSILQQRFARGEIDAETYKQMLATLTSEPVWPVER